MKDERTTDERMICHYTGRHYRRPKDKMHSEVYPNATLSFET